MSTILYQDREERLAAQIPLAATGVLVSLRLLHTGELTPEKRARAIHFCDSLTTLAQQALAQFTEDVS